VEVQVDQLKVIAVQMGPKIIAEVKKATAHLKPSMFDENNTNTIATS
jgi:hypothetical protein